MSNDDWDDLFKLAEGRSSSTSKGSRKEEVGATAPKAKRKLIASAVRDRNAKSRTLSSFDDYLSDRLSISTRMPPGFLFGSTISRISCPGAKFSLRNPDKKDCRRCGLSRFRHAISPSDLHHSTLERSLFCCLRNLRHLFFISIKDNMSVLTSLGPLMEQLKKFKRHHIVNRQSQLRTKLWGLVDNLQISLIRGSITFEQSVQVIMDCDAAYFSLYYLELTSNSQHHVPHPVFYFGESMEELSEAEKHILSQNVLICDSDLFERFPLRRDVTEEDPLTFIHYLRFFETVLIFHLSTWRLPSEKRKDEFIKSGQTTVGSTLSDLHETPAPPLLRAWRNSCRDFLTHVFAYATVPKNIRETIKSFAMNERIVEVGSGTGYLARLLCSQGLVVDAFDFRPGRNNEYHGSTPPYMSIESGDGVKTISQQRQPFVLLLCYPPPDSSMAANVLRGFLKGGGERFVHVGEFKGLTGTSKFEHILLKNFCCVRNIPCPTWGTDAASVTLWKRGSQAAGDSVVLLPCHMCGKESRQRLRYVRYLTYCSAQCWEKHQNGNLSKHLELATVELGSSLPAFGDGASFLSL